MDEVKDEMELAKALVLEVHTISQSLLPFSNRESELLSDRYAELHRKLIQNDKFTRQDEGGYLFLSGFQLQQFNDELQAQLHELAYRLNANPVCMARALVVFPKVYKSFNISVSKIPNKVVAEKTIQRYKEYIEQNKKRLELRSFEYDEKPTSKAEASSYSEGWASNPNNFTGNVSL